MWASELVPFPCQMASLPLGSHPNSDVPDGAGGHSKRKLVAITDGCNGAVEGKVALSACEPDSESWIHSFFSW